jgi:lysophospholipase L1-like esterase
VDVPDGRGVALRFTVLAMVLAITLGMAEAGLRISGLAPPPALSSVSEAEFRRIPGIFAPGQRVRQQPGTPFEHLVTIDTLGYRGHNFPRARPVGELRVFFAGDSFIFGHNVADHETLPAQLERLLSEQCGSSTVINAGLSGSTIVAQAELIRRGLVLDPSLVVLMYHENDIDELAHVRVWDQLAQNRRVKSTFPLSLAYQVARHSALGAVGLQARVAYQFRRQTLERDPEVVFGEAWLEPTRLEYRQRLQTVADSLYARGIPLLFVAFPHPESVTAGAGGRDYDWVLTAAADLGIPVVDLLPALLAGGVDVEDAYLVPQDYHPSPAGHALAAEHLAERLARTIAPRQCVETTLMAPELR